jgi:HAD superfamily hydrolase (TIGR01459 family)
LKRLSSVHELIGRYDAFFVDVWGVLHDGGQPFRGACDALALLVADGRHVVLLTNTSRLAGQVKEALAAIGIAGPHYHHIVTAGDVTRDALIADWLPKSPRVFHFGAPAFVPWLFELPFSFCDDVNEADLVIVTGAIADEPALAVAKRELEPAALRHVPLVCTNPDRLIPTANGMRFGPGAVAADYAAMGAPVFLYGKPHRPIYDAAVTLLDGIARDRILALGDTLETDIRGARAAGIACALVTSTGVHAGRLPELGTDIPDWLLDAFA